MMFIFLFILFYWVVLGSILLFALWSIVWGKRWIGTTILVLWFAWYVGPNAMSHIRAIPLRAEINDLHILPEGLSLSGATVVFFSRADGYNTCNDACAVAMQSGAVEVFITNVRPFDEESGLRQPGDVLAGGLYRVLRNPDRNGRHYRYRAEAVPDPQLVEIDFFVGSGGWWGPPLRDTFNPIPLSDGRPNRGTFIYATWPDVGVTPVAVIARRIIPHIGTGAFFSSRNYLYPRQPDYDAILLTLLCGHPVPDGAAACSP